MNVLTKPTLQEPTPLHPSASFRKMDEFTVERLRPLAHYIWWKPADDTLSLPKRLVARVMDIGTFEDVRLLTDILHEDDLRCVLTEAEVGQFSPRSWHYWHYRLGISKPSEVPPMPVRKTA